jgi:hypothetical protein
VVHQPVLRFLVGIDQPSVVTSAAQQGAAVASTVVASAAARMAPPGVVLSPFEVAGMRITEKRAMWSSHCEFAGSAGRIMIEGADNTARIRGQS